MKHAPYHYQSKFPQLKGMIILIVLLVGCSSTVLGQQWSTNGSDISNANAGNVGVGTASPTAKLHLVGANGAANNTAATAPDALQVIAGTGGNGTWGGSAGGIGGAINLTGGIGGGPVAGSGSAFGGKGGAINLTGGSGGPNTYAVGGGAGGDVLINGGAGVANPAGNVILANLRGKVGIGTASPTRPLEVLAGDGEAVRLYRNGNSVDLGVNIRFALNNSSGAEVDYAGVHGQIVTNTAGAHGGNLLFTTATSGSPTEKMRITPSGNVGIGTTAPLQKLQIGSNTATGTTTPDAVSLGATYSSVAGANPKLRLWDNNAGSVYGLGVSTAQFDFMIPATARYVWSVDGIEKMRLDAAGNITVSGNIAAKYQDVAEWVESSQELRAGTVVVLDSTKSNQVVASTQSYDTRVAGVISVRPGLALGEAGEDKVLVATTGRVRMKVDATSAPIQIGDLLVTGDKEGMAMKSMPVDIGGVRLHRPGTLIGKALEPLVKGTGEILVLLSLQ